MVWIKSAREGGVRPKIQGPLPRPAERIALLLTVTGERSRSGRRDGADFGSADFKMPGRHLSGDGQ